MDLIDRFRKWRLTHANEDSNSDDDDGDGSNDGDGGDDSDWDIGTIKEPVSPYIMDQNETSNGHHNNNGHESNGGVNGLNGTTVAETTTVVSTGASSPKRKASPTKEQVMPSSLGESGRVAKSEMSIVSATEMFSFSQILIFVFPFSPKQMSIHDSMFLVVSISSLL